MGDQSSFREKLHLILLDKFQHARPSSKVCKYSLKYYEAEEAIIGLFMDTFRKEALKVVDEFKASQPILTKIDVEKL